MTQKILGWLLILIGIAAGVGVFLVLRKMGPLEFILTAGPIAAGAFVLDSSAMVAFFSSIKDMGVAAITKKGGGA